MTPFPADSIVSALQTAVSPVILISGVGLLLLTMTNRLGRTIDRARALSSSDGSSRPEIRTQLDVLMFRAILLKRAILWSVVSALSAALLVIFLFIMMLFHKDVALFVCGLFVICMGALIGSLIYFMRDVNLSLEALRTKLKT